MANTQQYAWASGTTGMQKPEVAPLCRFEIEAERLGLTEAEYESSAELRAWAFENRNTYYVPTALLTAWRLTTVYDDGVKDTKLVTDSSEDILDQPATEEVVENVTQG